MDTKIERNKITIEQFADELVKGLISYYKEAEDKELDIRVEEIRKNNGVLLHGMIIRDQVSPIAPNIYIDGIYEQFLKGTKIEDCIEKAKAMYAESNKKVEIPDGFMASFSKVEDQIFPKVINHDKNDEMLKRVPHAKLGDLAVTFQVYLSEFDGVGICTVTITNDMCKIWGVGTEQILDKALQNLRSKSGISIRSLFSIVSEIMLKSKDYDADRDILQRHGEDGTPQMFVMTNITKVNGATGLLECDKLANFADRVDSDLYILPSSINELIIVPNKGMGYDVEKLLDMVKEVNASTVSKEEFLSDNVYSFNRKDRSLRMAITGEKIMLQVA